MTARILVVDDIDANVKLLSARLSAEYYEVLTARTGAEALAICADESVDLVLLDVMMPGMDGYETCRRLKSQTGTAHIPVVMVTALDQLRDRLQGLDAGADDFLTKPIDEVALIARVRSLVRLKSITDELRMRALPSTTILAFDPLSKAVRDEGWGGRILLVEDRPASVARIDATLQSRHTVDCCSDPETVVSRLSDQTYDIVIISLGLKDCDGLRLCGRIRSMERFRQVPIVLIADLEDGPRVMRALDFGINDFIVRPVEPNELQARVRTQLRRKRYADRLRDTLQASMELAVIDQLTGLQNRRSFELQVPGLLSAADHRNRPLCMMILDIDHFKRVNDTYGHDAGDDVLRIFAERVRMVIRDADLLYRLGGEEFIVVMPELPLPVAALVAERVRLAVSMLPFNVGRGASELSVTVSIGLADRGHEADLNEILKRADLALYRSKSQGRNQVSQQAA